MSNSTRSGDHLPTQGHVPLTTPFVAHVLEQTQISKYHTKGGHGFAAEDANHLADLARGQRAKIVGTSNSLNGADRVINGLQVQSKYYRTAAESVASAFDPSSGAYRYAGQKLEVPREQYEASLELMRKRIAQGQVPGYDSPADAEKIVHQGTVTYQQARNIARAGNLESIVFDAKSQAVTSSYVFALSFAVNYAQNRWRGANHQEASKASIGGALVAGSATLITGIITAQLLRTRVAAVGTIAARSGLKVLATTSAGEKVIHQIAVVSLRKAVSGVAAINHVSKLLRSNAIAGAVAATVASTPDFYRAAFERSISWRQFTKNVTLNIAGVAGGTAGWISGTVAGAAIGSVVPGVGTAVGGIVGGVIGTLGVGLGTSVAAKLIADKVADDDAKALLSVLETEIRLLSSEYLLNEEEVGTIAKVIGETANPNWLRQMFKVTASTNAERSLQEFVRNEFEPHFEELARTRMKVSLPECEELEADTSCFLEAFFKDVA